MTEWTREKDQILCDGINRGLSYREVALEIGGINRNAVAGRKWRLAQMGVKFLELDRKETSYQSGLALQRIHARVRRKPKSLVHKVKPRKEARMKPAIKPPVRERDLKTNALKPLKAGVLPMSANPKSIVDIGYRQCRAAVGEPPPRGMGVVQPYMFCGEPTEEGRSYCAEHGRLMFAPIKARSDRGMILSRIGISKGA